MDSSLQKMWHESRYLRVGKMIISERQIMQLIHLLRESIQDNLSDFGKSESQRLIDSIAMQQSDELKVIE